MDIEAGKVNQILKKHGYSLVMDMIHDETEMKKYARAEKNFNRRKYLTIKSKGIVIGRVYQVNSDKEMKISGITLNKQGLDIIIAFFRFFRIPRSSRVVEELLELTAEDINSIGVDLIRNNVFKQEAY